MFKTKEGLAAPLLFSALAIAAYGSAKAFTPLWFLALALLWLGAQFVPSTPRPAGLSMLGASVYAFGAWMVLTNLLANPSYTSSAPFQAAFLIGGFLVGRRAGVPGTPLLFSVAVAFAVAIASWALWQWTMLGALRAQSIFLTPAALGAVTNLVLVPAAALFVMQGRRGLLACVIVLACALSAAQSRGAWISLAVAGGLVLLLAWRAGVAVSRRRIFVVFAVLAIAAAVSVSIASNVTDITGSVRPIEETVSFTHRWLLYDLALRGLQSSSWLLGSGYQSFFYLLESSRPLPPAYVTSTTYFAHNDYLQTLLELGIPGLAALLGIALLPIFQAWRGVANAQPEDRPVWIALAGATASMAVHALGDFPFYLPVCVLLYGAALGILETQCLRDRRTYVLHARRALANATVRRAGVAGVSTVLVWLLAASAAAEGASEYGMRSWHAGRGVEAAWAFEAARRLDPRDWRYHWYAGQFWMAQASNLGDAKAAALADKALADGCAANPREVRPLHDRMVLHERLGRLLAAPAGPETLALWAEQTLKLAPADPGVRIDGERVLKRLAGSQK